jgi:ureidoglycolate dehydrogenase (NAD+)
MSNTKWSVGQRVTPAELTEFCVAAMLQAGMREEQARVTAEVLVTTDTWGVFTHGTKQVRPLLRHMRAGGLDPKAEPELVSQGLAWALFDGHYTMPPFTAVTAMKLAIQKAKTAGIGYAGVRHSSHFGAAGYYAMMAAREDLIGISMTNVDLCTTAPGAKGRVLGTNPIAYAAPGGKEFPVFLDIATSTVAASKVFAAKALGKTIPLTWLVDDEGHPTSDPNIFPAHGAMQPMAGYKGYGIAIMIEMLAGIVTGASFTNDVPSWIDATDQHIDQGHAFIAVDVNALMPIQEFKDRMDEMVRRVHTAPLAEGAERIYLPGEMEWERRADALTNGIPLPADVIANLNGVAEDWNV